MHDWRICLGLVMLLASPAGAEIQPEKVGSTTLAAPEPTWFFTKNALGSGYIYDAASGEMQGLLSLTPFTPAIQPNVPRGEIYAAETYYSRLYRGDRTDVLTIYDLKTLSPSGEVPLPKKVAALPFRQYIAMLGDRYVGVFNMTPAQSVSIVDVRAKRFVGEISTPGCALIMPVGDNDFLMLCGDGTLQLVRLDRRGNEGSRVRSDAFFAIDDDPVFDKPVRTQSGWQLLSFNGNRFEVTTNGDDIVVTKQDSVLDESDVAENWRPGGGQIMALHQGLDLLFVLMHQGKADTHEDPGSEIWVFNRGTNRRIGRLPLETTVNNIYVDQTDQPRLVASTTDRQLQIFDVQTLKLERTIEEPGAIPALIQSF